MHVSASAPRANWFARLSDVAPDGRVTLITGAGVNGAHRESATDPAPLVPGEIYPLDVEMHYTSWVFPEGHRIRLSVANAQWPMFWPSPDPMTTTLHLGAEAGTRLVLPVVAPHPRPRPEFLAPVEDPSLAGYATVERGTTSSYSELDRVERDIESGTATVVLTNRTAYSYPWGIHETDERITHRTNDLHPELSSVVGDYAITVRLEDRILRFQGVLEFSSDRESFHFEYTRRLERDGEPVRERSWRRSFARDHQ
jgi:hypothetical protein